MGEVHRRLGMRTIVGGLCTLAAGLAHVAVAGAAPAAVQIGQIPALEYATDGGDAAGDLTALFVDPQGTAHVAYVIQTPHQTPASQLDLCTIPAGATACGDHSVLATDVTTDSQTDATIDAIKYLPDGKGTADLAVSISGLGPGPPAFNPSDTYPYGESESFTPGSTTAVATGDTAVSTGETPGDEILSPDGSGIEVLGNDQGYDTQVTDDYTNSQPPFRIVYQFESLQSVNTDSSPFVFPNQEVQPGEAPFDVTELPDGATAVLDYDFTAPHAYSGAFPIGMRVLPAGGGTFGPLVSLGISGAAAATYAPGEPTYVFDVEAKQQGSDLVGGNPNVLDPLELYQFRGNSLKTIASLGTAFHVWYPSDWESIPPVSEDAAGDLAVAWLAGAGDDGCPGSATGASDNGPDTQCLVYRRIGNGGLLGPKIILSAQPTSVANLSPQAVAQIIAHLGPVSENTAGVGWELEARIGTNSPNSSTPSGEYTLYAQPLLSSGQTGTPSVSGSTVRVPVSCAGPSSAKCGLIAQLQSGAHKNAQISRKSKGATVLATKTLSLNGGRKAKLKLALSKRAKLSLRKGRRELTVELLVGQKVGVIKTPTLILAKKLVLR
jgi:hypothetical protein